MTDVSLASDRGLMMPEPGRVQIGTVWRRSLSTFGRAPLTFVAFVVLPLIVSAVQIGVQFAMTNPAAGASALKTPQGLAVIVSLVLTVLQYTVQIVSQGASIHIAARLLSGDRFTWANAIGVGFRRMFPLLGVGILVGLSIVLGFILLIVPGFIVALVLMLAVPACVVERLGPINAMKRSAYLTQSNRWRILAAFLVMVVLPIFATFAILIGASFVLDKLPLGVLAVTLFIILLPCIGAISVIMLTTLFVELRALKDGGTAPRSMAQVFE